MSATKTPVFGQVSADAYAAWVILRNGGVWSARDVMMESRRQVGRPKGNPTKAETDRWARALRQLNAHGFLRPHGAFHYEVW